MIVTDAKLLDSPSRLEAYRAELASAREGKPCVIVSASTCGTANGAEALIQALRSELKKRRLAKKVILRVTGCLGFCEQEPLLIFRPSNIFYPRPAPQHVPRLLEESLLKGQVAEDLCYRDPQTQELVWDVNALPFYRQQQRLVLGGNAEVDPCSIEDYLVAGGYAALPRVLSGMSPEQVIEEVRRSGLRGRGGGGFPTGQKWQVCCAAAGDKKFIICNADEGDPGAYMDRAILEGNPHSVLEGMLIGAFAIGAEEGYVYVRAEYPLAVHNLTIAIQQATDYGLLGEGVLGSKLNFRVHISRGAGAFVCGEETALIASIEGRLGTPSPRPPYPAECGLWGQPTVINNVETWANVPLVITRGAEWFSGIGTETSKGTKVFSLVGKVNNTGLVEVPMGIRLRQIVFDIGAGVPKGRKFKAVQTGGPSGGVIPESLLDLPIDYEALTEAGAMMGSGGMIVMDDRTCIVDVARYFMNFLREESCGKCTPCREGIKNMLGILTRICEGQGSLEDLTRLKDLAEGVKAASLCGLGTTAPNPVLSTLKHFQDEYIAHVVDKRCPAGVCTALISLSIDADKCKACGRCLKVCPTEAIRGGTEKVPASIDPDKCIRCKACFETCPFEAVTIT